MVMSFDSEMFLKWLLYHSAAILAIFCPSVCVVVDSPLLEHPINETAMQTAANIVARCTISPPRLILPSDLKMPFCNMHMIRCTYPFCQSLRAIYATMAASHAAKGKGKICLSPQSVGCNSKAHKRLYGLKKTLNLI